MKYLQYFKDVKKVQDFVCIFYNISSIYADSLIPYKLTISIKSITHLNFSNEYKFGDEFVYLKSFKN